jgi:DNA (cytosine-5)-methyltransferase 1
MNLYNDFDSKACAWLRELVKEGQLPRGDVIEKPFQDLTYDQIAGRKQCHWFAGIGGWPYALKLAGWPATQPVWTASLPCQPFSQAGKMRGEKDERHVWPDFSRLIREHRPDTIFGEQVPAAIEQGWLDGVFADLEAEGYTCGAVVLGAHSVGAPHMRQRLYWVAYANGGRWKKGRLPEGKSVCKDSKKTTDFTGDDGQIGELGNTNSKGLAGRGLPVGQRGNQGEFGAAGLQAHWGGGIHRLPRRKIAAR